ncbi:MAG: TatD family hydrolase, partial [Deltaproteobacteria bacterium]|nr:TatD family hydrolase [Deltaproteobacteria bacterium]
EYLKHENAVGLGEIGMDAGLEAEERLFRAHLNLAKENDMPIIVHTPTPLEPQFSIIREETLFRSVWNRVPWLVSVYVTINLDPRMRQRLLLNTLIKLTGW